MCAYLAQAAQTDHPSTRFLSIRLSPDEFDEVYRQLQKTTCRSLTEYAKKMLTNKPIVVKVRDQTREDILQQLGLIKSRLDTLIDMLEPTAAAGPLNELTEIKSIVRQIAQQCLL
ncbi:MAG TPA: hypothetical protein VHE54_01515 [Puia sp.]|nr:hypothetical protein [Puia sp.]